MSRFQISVSPVTSTVYFLSEIDTGLYYMCNEEHFHRFPSELVGPTGRTEGRNEDMIPYS